MLKFYCHRAAEEYFNSTKRITRSKYFNVYYILDKTLPNPRTKFIFCKHCKTSVAKSIARSGFCKSCSNQYMGLKYLGIKNSQRMLGKNNPNFKDGKSNSTWRQQRIYRDWRKKILLQFPNCIVCNLNINRHTHHILPYALFPQYKFESWNGITLCGQHHKELHRLQLDLLLLPILYESLQDALQLQQVIQTLPEFQKLHLIHGGKVDQSEILRLVPKNYRKRIFHLHPEFAQLVLGL